MIVILDSDENILEFLDDESAVVEITDTYGGYNSLDFECSLTNVKRDKYLFKQGNKILLENILFVINTEVEIDFLDNTISVEAEEYLNELNNCEPFYIKDPLYSNYVAGNTITISKNFLNVLFDGFFTVDKTDLDSIKSNLKIVTVQGTITKYNLIKEIETNTGLMFKRSYSITKGNTIKKSISLLTPENYGVTHSQLLKRVTVGENTDKLEYSSDESKNALGIMPIIKSENTAQVNYSNILKRFYDLDVNNDRVMPYYTNFSILESDLLDTAKNLNAKIKTFGQLPETIPLAANDEILNIGMGQFLNMATMYMFARDNIPLRVIEVPESVESSVLDCVFERSDIYVLANFCQQYMQKTNVANSSVSSSYGRVSFQWLVYIIAEWLTTGKSVVCKTKDYPNLVKTIPSSVEYNVNRIIGTDNFEYMPFLYTQNTSDSNKIPYIVPANDNSVAGKNCYDVTKYVSESYPKMVIRKTPGASEVEILIIKQNISQDSPTSFVIKFKSSEVPLIQDDSDIEIDFANQTIKYMKLFQNVTIITEQHEVTEMVGSDNVITVNMMPSCGCCAGTPYKRYTKTWENYCPNCKRHGTLRDNPKGVYEGEITCSMKAGGCDADYCGYCGGDKWGGGKCRRVKLNPAEAQHAETKVVEEQREEITSEYKEVNASQDDSNLSETQLLLADILQFGSGWEEFYGDVSIHLKGATLKSLTSDSVKLYELSPFPYIKKKGEMFIYAPVTTANFNYTHMSNDNPKLEPFETSEQSVEEVLIGCWKKLNGSGDNTDWLEKSEDIKVDLTEENIDLNAGDFVYIKLPDTNVFKAQIVEKKYNPKIKSDSSLKIGNVSRESIT